MTLSVVPSSNNAEIRDHLSRVGIPSENFRTTCPLCSPGRKKQNERTLSIRMDESYAVWICHHCEEKGSTNLDTEDLPFMQDDYIPHVSKPVTPSGPTPIYSEVTEQQLAYLSTRGITASTAKRCGMVSRSKYIASVGEERSCIGFPYVNKDGSTAVKWRDGQKHFTQTGSAQSLWRISEFQGGDLIIAEGELDAVSFEEIGHFATSVPNGAPSKVSDDPDPMSKKYMYLNTCEEEIKNADKIILASDNDGPGLALAEEIARRVGKSRCWKLVYPEDCKDANDVLKLHGPKGLQDVLDNAVPWPIGGLIQASAYEEQALALYRDGMDQAVDVSVGNLSSILKPSPGTLGIFTGIPGSGKSTFTTWLSYILAARFDWPCAVFSAETSSQVHLLQLAALRIGKPFMGPDRMDEAELRTAIKWIDDRFVFLSEAETTLESILDRGHAAIMRNGARLLLIDPFNFVSGEGNDDDGSTMAINKILVRLKTFAVEHDVAVWLVAHPKKMERFQGKNHTPGGYDIAGSAHFFNVADNGITLERDPEAKWVSRVVSWKSRFPWIGSLGSVKLSLDEVGSYSKVKEWGDDVKDWGL